MIRINGGQATLGANTFTGAQVAPSLALGGATIGSNALSVTGAALFNTGVTFANGVVLSFGSRGYLDFVSDGVVRLLNNAGNDFSRLQFGGTTSSFPSIKRNATALNFRLADDSADAPITAAAATFSGAITYGGVTLSSVTGTGNMVLSAAPSFTGLPLFSGGIYSTNSIQIVAAAPALLLDKSLAAGQNSLYGKVGNVTRWELSPGAATTNNFQIFAFNASGGYVGSPLSIDSDGTMKTTFGGPVTLSSTLTVPGVTTAALTSTGTFTSGAAAQVGTLTNAPAAGNPTTWIKIIDGGVTRYIPAW